jgi:hypothetical protein
MDAAPTLVMSLIRSTEGHVAGLSLKTHESMTEPFPLKLHPRVLARDFDALDPTWQSPSCEKLNMEVLEPNDPRLRPFR